MLHNDVIYEDMDPDYRTRIFYARKKLLGSVESPTILPDNNLNARSLLNDEQLNKVHGIRERKLAAVIDRFSRD